MDGRHIGKEMNHSDMVSMKAHGEKHGCMSLISYVCASTTRERRHKLTLFMDLLPLDCFSIFEMQMYCLCLAVFQLLWFLNPAYSVQGRTVYLSPFILISRFPLGIERVPCFY